MIRNVALVLFTTFKAFENFPKKKNIEKNQKAISRRKKMRLKKRERIKFFIYISVFYIGAKIIVKNNIRQNRIRNVEMK